jgi:membrane peptidoglycan carboxypeptidase
LCHNSSLLNNWARAFISMRVQAGKGFPEFIMPNLFRKKPTGHRPTNWRDFQAQLQRKSKKRGNSRHAGIRIAVLLFLTVLVIYAMTSLFRHKSAEESPAAAQASVPSGPAFELNSKSDVLALFTKLGLNNLDGKRFELPLNHQILQVETSLHPGLQNYLLQKMDRKNSRFIGIVAMDANTGRILALAGFDREEAQANPCLRSEFPAASIFKIVTAAAAVDHCGLKENSKLHFNGYKHTLYKSQLKEKINRYTNTISFKNAFAQSVNPVFGKIGKLYLGGNQLKAFADAFGFNTLFNFELPHAPSHFKVEDRPYYWAELASGFNNDTTLSPLHGAVMASAVLNEGYPVTPSIVDRILDREGNIIYQGNPALGPQAMSAEASAVLRGLMETTISAGTGRKSFRGYRRDKTLSRLHIGGKTGSIDNRTHDQRFDWFVGFARERQGNAGLAVAVMVAHQDYIGIRATRYARMAMKYYFQNCLPAEEPELPSRES